MTTRWIVTRELNDYNQDGEYFVGVFDSKPNFKDLKKLLPGEDDITVGKLTRGGGRQRTEHIWFNLKEVKVGVNVEEGTFTGR